MLKHVTELLGVCVGAAELFPSCTERGWCRRRVGSGGDPEPVPRSVFWRLLLHPLVPSPAQGQCRKAQPCSGRSGDGAAAARADVGEMWPEGPCCWLFLGPGAVS